MRKQYTHRFIHANTHICVTIGLFLNRQTRTFTLNSVAAKDNNSEGALTLVLCIPFAYMYAHTHTHTFVHARVRTYTRTHIYTYIHTHTRTHRYAFKCSLAQ